MCKYCTNKKQLLTINVPDITFEENCAEEELQLIIDKGYLRLCRIDDMECMDHGEKVKIKYCPMCGNDLNKIQL